MSYYHTARAHVRALKNLGEDHKRRAERRAELANVEVRRRAWQKVTYNGPGQQC